MNAEFNAMRVGKYGKTTVKKVAKMFMVYHDQTLLSTILPNGQVILRSGKMRTREHLNVINRVLEQVFRGVELVQNRGKWFLKENFSIYGNMYHFQEAIKIERRFGGLTIVNKGIREER